jgi:hypothetical protein
MVKDCYPSVQTSSWRTAPCWTSAAVLMPADCPAQQCKLSRRAVMCASHTWCCFGNYCCTVTALLSADDVFDVHSSVLKARRRQKIHYDVIAPCCCYGRRKFTALASGLQSCRLLEIIRRFGKHGSCHLHVLPEDGSCNVYRNVELIFNIRHGSSLKAEVVH